MTIRRAIAATIVVLSIGGGGASTAAAADYTYVARDFVAGENYGSPTTYFSMTRSEGYAPSNHSIRVGARTPNGVLYGSWAGGSSGYVCKNYAANSLMPLIANTYSSTFKIYGYAGTGSGQGC